MDERRVLIGLPDGRCQLVRAIALRSVRVNTGAELLRITLWGNSRSISLVVLPIISGLWLAIGVGIISALTPNYSHIDQFMSALGAVGAPLATWTNYAVFIPTEIWLLAFLARLNSCLPGSRTKRISILLLSAYAILLILAAFLPCDAGCDSRGSDENMTSTLVHIAHMAIAVTAYPLALIGLLILSLTAPPNSLLRRLAPPATIVGFCLFITIFLMPLTQGLFQRLLEAWIYFQFISLGLYAASILPQN
ncbi:DUF998 domain-containing protein [Ruegeria atlantica]|uniref:DUF998 domain-containing protein n=1 Tax=Ruegeria atlantica TaxID=81569 RepID=UPI0024959BBF|nr:DUF998 domain-containing protein [Ruegeria atlantica]